MYYLHMNIHNAKVNLKKYLIRVILSYLCEGATLFPWIRIRLRKVMDPDLVYHGWMDPDLDPINVRPGPKPWRQG